MCNQVASPDHCVASLHLPSGGVWMLLNSIFVAGGLGPHAEVCLCMGQFDELQGQLPMQSLYLMTQDENLISLCCGESGCCENGAYLRVHELSTTLNHLMHTT